MAQLDRTVAQMHDFGDFRQRLSVIIGQDHDILQLLRHLPQGGGQLAEGFLLQQILIQLRLVAQVLVQFLRGSGAPARGKKALLSAVSLVFAAAAIAFVYLSVVTA